VNARVHTYWLGQDATAQATLTRAARYVRAGADGGVRARRVRTRSPARDHRERRGAGEHAGIPGVSISELAELGV
jgi:hypothetical protein